MISNQPHRVRLKILIKRITMNIKFPCSLTVQVKSGTIFPYEDTTYDLRKAYEIKSGQCLINQSLSVEVEVEGSTIRNRLQDKKIAINVYMISMSGKVSAGFALLSLLGKQLNTTTENVQFLEKCPDKGAKIYYSYSIEVIRNKSERLDKTLIS